jgi:ribosomal protein L40E
MKCGYCGQKTLIPSDSPAARQRVAGIVTQPVTPMPICTRCGFRNVEGARFCGNCGAQVSAVAIPNPPTDVKRFHSPFAVEFDPSTVSESVKESLRNNIELLGDLGKKHVPQIYKVALRSVLAGRDLRMLSTALIEIAGMSRDRAADIARSLHNKATEQINRERQYSLGITHAIWMYPNAPCMKEPFSSCPTAADIRQDSAHRAANGKKYEIAKGLFVGGKWTRPGVEEGCKCASRSVLPWTTPGDAKPSAAMALRYRKCAEQGDAIAQYNLGLDSSTGRCVPQDYVEAYFWFDLAAGGKPQADLTKLAVEAREEVASHLSPADLSCAQERTRKWVEGHPPKLYAPEEE